ncbi:TIGR00730 family Rossman fold protein [Opitutaceae bacterium EW11]|nr:TIGR00730 family Rossman fold protein [Opitutaceae bacterium EW11]
MQITVYCSSSAATPVSYRDAAFRLGSLCAKRQVGVVYGGGGIGSMGHLADGVLSEGGRILGVMPHFMRELEWAHAGVADVVWTDDLSERKKLLMERGEALVALPGGSGTLEELLEAITAKRLGIYLRPIIIVNQNGFFDGLITLLDRCISEEFMDARHRQMWTVVGSVDEVFDAIAAAPAWSAQARAFATKSPKQKGP